MQTELRPSCWLGQAVCSRGLHCVLGGGPRCLGAAVSGHGCAHTTPSVYRSEQSAAGDELTVGFRLLPIVRSWLSGEPCKPVLALVGAAGGDGAGFWGNSVLLKERLPEERPALRASSAGVPNTCAPFRKKGPYVNQKNHIRNLLFLQNIPSPSQPSPSHSSARVALE